MAERGGRRSALPLEVVGRDRGGSEGRPKVREGVKER